MSVLDQVEVSEQVSSKELGNRSINLAPIFVAHQLVLLPLYFFLPIWIFIFNSIILFIVYLAEFKGQFVVVKAVKTLLTLVAFAGVFFSFYRLAGRDAGVALIAIMYGLKIIEIKAKRDVYILMLLGFFLLLSTFLFSHSFFIVLYQILPVMAILYALQSIHTINLGHQFNQKQVSEDQYWFHQLFFNSSVRYLIKQLLKYLMLALPIMVLLFLFFPRLSGPIWKMPNSGSATSGISESMTPGEISSLHLSDKIAFRARFDGEEPDGNDFYWRTLVLDTFDGLTWIHANSAESNVWVKNVQEPFQEVSSMQALNSNKSYQYEIALEPTQQKWLTFLDRPVRIPSSSVVFDDFSVSDGQNIYSRLKYEAESKSNLKLDLQLSKFSRQLNTNLPAGYNPRSTIWAIDNRKNYATDELFVQSILKKINREEYFYTLSPPIMDENTVDDFWLDEKRGFCEHYSGTLVFLARAANIPARVVIGYQGAEKNILSDYWIIRYLNAHAWVEIWFSDKGWVRIDPTAAIAEHRVEKQLLTDYSQRNSLFESFNFQLISLDNVDLSKQFEFWLDQVNSGWNDWVLAYNQNLQQKLMVNLGLDNFSREQIAFLSLFCILGFMLLINFSWGFKNVKDDVFDKAINLLIKKLAQYNIIVTSNKGFTQFVKELEVANLSKTKELHDNKLSQNSFQELKKLIEDYQLIRYGQNNCSISEQKAFYARIKKLKLTRLRM